MTNLKLLDELLGRKNRKTEEYVHPFPQRFSLTHSPEDCKSPNTPGCTFCERIASIRLVWPTAVIDFCTVHHLKLVP